MKDLPAICCALIAAALFGAYFPIAKHLLAGIPALEASGLIYLSGGLAVGLLRALLPKAPPEQALRRSDSGWIVGIVVSGGIAGPLFLLWGLARTPAHVASLLSNSETVFTVILAAVFFGDLLRRRELLGAALILTGATIVVREPGAIGGPSGWQGPLLILAAGFAWGLDNNFTQRLSTRDPLAVSALKGVASGVLSLGLAAATGGLAPLSARSLAWALGFGVIGQGGGLTCFLLALRRIGAARTSALYATAPIFGVLISWAAFGEAPGLPALLGGALMVPAVLLFVRTTAS